MPKPQLMIRQDGPLHVLEVSAGADAVECVTDYVRQHGRVVSLLGGKGVVANVTLRPWRSPPEMTLIGRFRIVKLMGFIRPPPAPPEASWLVVFLVGEQGQLITGSVVGPLVASEPIMLTALVANATHVRLPLENEDEAASAAAGEGQQPGALHSLGVNGGGGDGGGSGAGSVPFYNLGGNTGISKL